MKNINLTETNNKNTFLRKCVECREVFESDKITCPKCNSKMTTVSFTETELEKGDKND